MTMDEATKNMLGELRQMGVKNASFLETGKLIHVEFYPLVVDFNAPASFADDQTATTERAPKLESGWDRAAHIMRTGRAPSHED
jgi:hypothetical protein